MTIIGQFVSNLTTLTRCFFQGCLKRKNLGTVHPRRSSFHQFKETKNIIPIPLTRMFQRCYYCTSGSIRVIQDHSGSPKSYLEGSTILRVIEYHQLESKFGLNQGHKKKGGHSVAEHSYKGTFRVIQYLPKSPFFGTIKGQKN